MHPLLWLRHLDCDQVLARCIVDFLHEICGLLLPAGFGRLDVLVQQIQQCLIDLVPRCSATAALSVQLTIAQATATF